MRIFKTILFIGFEIKQLINKLLYLAGLKKRIKIIDKCIYTGHSVPRKFSGLVKNWHYKYKWRWKKMDNFYLIKKHIVYITGSGSCKLIPTIEIFYAPHRIIIAIEWLWGGIGWWINRKTKVNKEG